MGETKRILIIDDDELLSGLLCDELRARAGYQCVIANRGDQGLTAAKDSHYDLILLDVKLPDEDGREVCRKLRAAGVSAPIVMLTADASEATTIEGLDAGATDYVSKPFKLGVLLARIRAHIRQYEHSEDAVLKIGRFAFRPGAKTLTHADDDGHDVGEAVRLTDKEAQILKYLYMHAHNAQGSATVGRDELLGEVWGYNAGVTTHTLETHVYRLRQKIERDPSHAEILITDTGGYRLGS